MLEHADVAVLVALLSAIFSGLQAYVAYQKDQREQAERDPIFDLVVESPPDPNLFCLATFDRNAFQSTWNAKRSRARDQ